MNRIGKMILMTSAQDRNRRNMDRSDSPRYEYDRGGRMDGGGPEYDGPDSRFRDRRGREHYDNGRFAPQNDGGTWVESRYWDDREAYRGPESRYPMTTPYVPPVYQDYGGERGGQRPMNRIGFRMSGDMDQRPPEFDREYRTDAGHRGMDEMAYRGGERIGGHGSGSGGRPFDREMAQEWVQRMKNADGTTGPHWTMEKTEEARAQRGIKEALIKSTCADCQPNFLSGKAKNRRNPDGFQGFLTQPGGKFGGKTCAGIYSVLP